MKKAPEHIDDHQKSNSSTNSNSTQTPTNPSWITQPLQSDVGNIMALGNVPASSYVAPQTGLQLQANQQGADTLSGTNPNYTAGAANIAANSSIGANQINQFLSPYLSNVLNSSNAQFDQNSAMQNANLEAQGAANGAFGGSRFGVAQGVLGGQQSLARGQLDSNILNTGYNTATQTALANAGLGLTAGQAQGNLGAQQSASNVANIAELAGLGGQQQATNQAIAAAPIALAQAQGGLLAQLPINSYTGENLTGQSNSNSSSSTLNPMQIISGLAGIAGAGLTGGGSLAGLFAPMASAGTQAGLGSMYAAGGLGGG